MRRSLDPVVLGDELPLLGRHRLIAEIGRGGMAEVFLAVTQGPGGFHKLVVVKRLRTQLHEDPEFVAMFLDEARLAARLAHPNVVQTIEVGEDRGRHFMVMEYLDGQPLHRIVARARTGGGFPLRMQLRVIADVLAGLHYAHELRDFDGSPLGVVHRDVSPHNVIVTYDGQCKLLDFGIAKALDSTSETRAGVLKGKVVYMAPEQARLEKVDRRADLFAVGMMLWEAGAGRRMWKNASDSAVLPQLIEGKLVPLLDVNPEAPPRLAQICARALMMDPRDRHATAADMQRDVEALIDELGERPNRRAIGENVSAIFADQRERVRATIEEQLRRVKKTGTFTALPALETESTQPTESEITHPSTPFAMRSATGHRVVSAPVAPLEPLGKRGAFAAIAALSIAAAGGVYVMRNRAPEQPQTKSIAQPPPIAPMSAGCASTDKPLVEVSGDIDKDFTLGCENDYLLKFTTFVRAGATLTIQPGTTLKGDKATKGTLVVQPGGRLVARGSRDLPIVFTSQLPLDQRKPGDWGGVILLGRAPLNLRGADGKPARGQIEGITSGGVYGGNDPDDDSGALEWVRIEYSGVVLGPNNEINGLTLGGVGRRTKIDHVMVRQTADDCFEFFGGTVDAKHLVCQYGGDDGFDWDYGYRGRLQFLVLQQDPGVVDDTNGFEGDNDPNGSANEPVSEPIIFNATMCGMHRDVPKEQYGMLLRRGTRAHIANSIFMGFDAALDVRDARTKVDVRSSIFFMNALGQPNEKDDDDGFDESAFLLAPMRKNLQIDPGIPGCFDADKPRLAPAKAISGNAAVPPDDGFFDPRATYVGAFRDVDDDWATGAWAAWSSR
ncbi:MAG: serine/threonine protein kinase [Polyangiales bacterium]